MAKLQWVKVHDLYDWLPGYGESSVSICAQRGRVDIFVEYDFNETSRKKVFRFKDVTSLLQASYPGPSGVKGPPSADNLGALLELPNSEQARAWMEHFGDWSTVKHYRLIFLAENLLLEVFASEVSIEDVP